MDERIDQLNALDLFVRNLRKWENATKDNNEDKDVNVEKEVFVFEIIVKHLFGVRNVFGFEWVRVIFFANGVKFIVLDVFSVFRNAFLNAVNFLFFDD